MANREFKIVKHSPDKQRVVVEVSRNGKTGQYLVVKGLKTVIWVRPRGRSYVISADKCNCPTSRGQCKHVLVTNGLKAKGFLGEERWVKYVPVAAKVEVPARG